MLDSKRPLWKSLCFLIGISFLSFVLFSYLGKASDCKPHQIDGQCGMSSFFGFVFGILSGLVILTCGGIYLAIKRVREKREIKVQKEVLPE
jgi:hypothetical protein